MRFKQTALCSQAVQLQWGILARPAGLAATKQRLPSVGLQTWNGTQQGCKEFRGWRHRQHACVQMFCMPQDTTQAWACKQGLQAVQH